MARPRKGKIKVRQKVGLRKKSEAPADKTRVAPRQMPRDNGINMRVKLKKKQ